MVATCSRLGILLPSSEALPAASEVRTGAMECPASKRVCATTLRESSGWQCTRDSAEFPRSAASSRMCLMVCSSISCSLRGLPPLETLLRRWRRIWMKSLALIMPTILADSVSHRGAEAIPCSYKAWNACRTGSSVSSNTTFPLSGMSSYAVWLARNSITFFFVISAAAAKGSSGCSAMGATTPLCSAMSTSSDPAAFRSSRFFAASSCCFSSACCSSICWLEYCGCSIGSLPERGSVRRTKSQLLTFPRGSGMFG
mmetsp:Transcript_22495/g.62395  ORF Transcript_22495/g.62395 Transcript_22495/m.62395 type:complete len:256 (+) Transcript_22495:860-1627(+)